MEEAAVWSSSLRAAGGSSQVWPGLALASRRYIWETVGILGQEHEERWEQEREPVHTMGTEEVAKVTEHAGADEH